MPDDALDLITSVIGGMVGMTTLEELLRVDQADDSPVVLEPYDRQRSSRGAISRASPAQAAIPAGLRNTVRWPSSHGQSHR